MPKKLKDQKDFTSGADFISGHVAGIVPKHKEGLKTLITETMEGTNSEIKVSSADLSKVTERLENLSSTVGRVTTLTKAATQLEAAKISSSTSPTVNAVL